MADTTGTSPSQLDDQFDFSAADLSRQFEQLLKTRRLNELEEQARAQRPSSPSSQRSATRSPYGRPSPQPQPQPARPHTTSVYQRTPLVPCTPQDPQSLKFRNMLLTLSVTPTKYENPGLLDEALTYVPIDRIYNEAEEEHNVMKGVAASVGKKEDWGYQDCVIRAMLRSANHNSHINAVADMKQMVQERVLPVCAQPSLFRMSGRDKSARHDTADSRGGR